jgi:hypothetical protein
MQLILWGLVLTVVSGNLGDNGIGVFKRESATLHSFCLVGEWFAGHNTNLVARCRILANPWDNKTTVSEILLHNPAHLATSS